MWKSGLNLFCSLKFSKCFFTSVLDLDDFIDNRSLSNLIKILAISLPCFVVSVIVMHLGLGAV